MLSWSITNLFQKLIKYCNQFIMQPFFVRSKLVFLYYITLAITKLIWRFRDKSHLPRTRTIIIMTNKQFIFIMFHEPPFPGEGINLWATLVLWATVRIIIIILQFRTTRFFCTSRTIFNNSLISCSISIIQWGLFFYRLKN